MKYVVDKGKSLFSWSSRPKRKKNSSNSDNIENAAFPGQATSEGKGALYHCNYCNKDITSVVRVKCAVCPDFDLCVECFSVGAEVTPHKCNHPYRIMDNLSFPLICPDWNADEEILLLEGIDMYGFGNWAEVAEHVGTKSKSQCIDHYNAVYMNSPCFPLPEMSHVMGKSREELVAMAKEHEVKKEYSSIGELTPKEVSRFSAKIESEDSRKEDPDHKSSSSLVGEPQTDRSIGEKKPRVGCDEGPSVTEFGYNFKRQEFEIEYDNDAEQLLADMEFKNSDTDAERELKLRVLRIYSKRLDERKRRKDFILERNLLYPDPFEKNLSPEEKQIYQRYKVFMRFHSKEEHEELLKSVIEEHRIVKKIQVLQEARAAGCRTVAEANRFIEEKRKKDDEESAHRLKEGIQISQSGKVLQRTNNLKGEVDGSPRGAAKGLQPFGKDSSSTTTGQAISISLDDWDINAFLGADLLSDTEKRLCCEIRVLPSHYLNMLQTISMEIMKGNITKKSDAYNLFKVEPSKVDRIYDMLVKKGIAQA